MNTIKFFKDSVNWNKMSKPQKTLSVKFGLSFSLMLLTCFSFVGIVFTISTVYYCLKVSSQLNSVIDE